MGVATGQGANSSQQICIKSSLVGKKCCSKKIKMTKNATSSRQFGTQKSAKETSSSSTPSPHEAQGSPRPVYIC